MTTATIRRYSQATSVTVGASTAGSTSVSLKGVAGGCVIVSGLTASATLTVHGSVDGLTFAPVHDSSGAVVTLAVPAAGGAVPLPDAAFGVSLVRLVSGTDIGTSASMVVTVKS